MENVPMEVQIPKEQGDKRTWSLWSGENLVEGQYELPLSLPRPQFFSSILISSRQAKVGFFNFALFCSVKHWEQWDPFLQVLGITFLFSYQIQLLTWCCYCELSSVNSDYLQMRSNLFWPNLPPCLLSRLLLELFPGGNLLPVVHSAYYGTAPVILTS